MKIETEIGNLSSIHGKKIKSLTESWVDDKKCIQLTITFDDDTELKIEPYIDKNAKFESSRNDLRLKYN